MSSQFEPIVQSNLVIRNHEIARDHKRLSEKHIRLIQMMPNSVFDFESKLHDGYYSTEEIAIETACVMVGMLGIGNYDK